jgi:formylglycine-generating enzyme required for sulfatase activity
MAGNVNEWVMDVYRPLTNEDNDDFRPFRGSVYQTQERDDEGNVAEKDSLGRIRYRNVTDDEAFNRRNYNTADNINYLDGDYESSVDYNTEGVSKDNTNSKRMYNTGKEMRNETGKLMLRGGDKMTSMIDNRQRVFKGGGWKDRAYWMSPGTRRFLDQEQARADLGFRCAVHRVGSAVGGFQ